jgi:hypothetical protein
MIDWVNTHGIVLLIGYYFLISILGTMPELPSTATYYQKWAYAAAHAICGNMKSLAASLQKQPDVKKDGQ